MPRLILILATLALLAGGGVLALAASSGPGRDPAPPARTADVPGLVSVARPVTPIPVQSDPPSAIEMRIAEPGGARRAVLAFRELRTASNGRRIDRMCLLNGPERELKKIEEPLGNCRDARSSEPWSIASGASPESSVISGIATDAIKRLTVAGPGGTLEVPVSRSGAFLIVYGKRASGRAVLTARLRDGSTRFYRTAIPPEFLPPGIVRAPDPGGLPGWFTRADTRTRGPLTGKTCLQIQQRLDVRVKNQARAGGTFLEPTCGDLRENRFFARTIELRPQERLGAFGPGPNAPPRTILAGAVSDQIRSVAVDGPDGRRRLSLADAGRAFLAVYPAEVSPTQLTLELTRTDGTVERIANPVAVNRATSPAPPPRLVGKVQLRLDGPNERRVELRARLSAPAKRFRISFLGRPVTMRRRGGTANQPEYIGVYDGTRGKQRPLTPNVIQRFTVVLCGDGCSTELQRARLKQ